MENIASIKKEIKDIPWVHYARVLACVMVVCLHSLPAGQVTGIDGVFRYGVVMLTRPCVPLFLMITGFLLLRNQHGDIDAIPFWRKRIPRIFWPLLIWGAIYALMPYSLGIADLKHTLYELALSPVKYPQEIGGILWYLFILIGLYMILPFFSQRIWTDIKIGKIYIAVWMVASVVAYFKCFEPKLLGVVPFCNFDALMYFSGYFGYLLAGLYMGGGNMLIFRGVNFAKRTVVYSLIYICCIIFIWLFTVSDDTSLQLGSFLSLFTIVMSVILFDFIRCIKWSDNSKLYKYIRSFSKLSFAVYLCHMTIYSYLTKNLYSISTSPLMQILVMISTLAGATLLAWILYKLPYHKYTIGT